MNRRLQQGVVVFIALIILVALSLAGIATLRSVETGTVIAGNLAFKQGTVLAADLAAESARAYLGAQAVVTGDPLAAGDDTANGYYRFVAEPTGGSWASYDWVNAAKTLSSADSAGNKVSYVIHRLCSNGSTVTCLSSTGTLSAAGGTVATSLKAGAVALPLASGSSSSGTLHLYRVTARVVGPRNTVTIVQTILRV